MSFLFQQDLKDIRDFYKSGKNHFDSLVVQATSLPLGVSLQTQVVQEVSQRSSSFGRLLRRMIPVMLCSSWENFVNDLKNSDPAKHQAKFTLYAVYYNEPIKEIALIRNCIIHQQSKIDSEYLAKSNLKTYTVLGAPVDFSESDLELLYKTFEDAYGQVIS